MSVQTLLKMLSGSKMPLVKFEIWNGTGNLLASYNIIYSDY